MAKPGTDPPAQSVAGSADSGRRRMPENRAVMTDTVCANGRDGRTPAARNTSGGIHPGRGVEELRPGMNKPKAYRGATGGYSS